MYNRIKQILDHSGLNQQDFAERISIAPATLSNIVKGRVAKYSTDLVMSIVAAFPEIDPMWLMTGKGEMFLPSSPSENSDEENPDSMPQGDAVEGGPHLPSFATGSEGTLFDHVLDESFSNGMRIASNSSALHNGAENRTAPNPASRSSLMGNRGQVNQKGGRMGTSGQPLPGSFNRNNGVENPEEYARKVSHIDPRISAQNPALYGLNYIEKPLRKIKEIRVFFDDDTFEVFSPYKI
ncbi:MAG: helix-turn-helix transcriptional regulator [Bacteroidaceae bacterium]|nr:helix-turn-helix transcriptional regulator [Bacteroidaceae bacterium]